MRHLTIVVVAALAFASDASAQRAPRPRIGGRPRPAALPPQPEAITRDLRYKRLRYSVESYPFMSFVDAPNFTTGSVFAHWRTGGVGTRADFRIKPFLSATLDLTSSFIGGPARTETVELGLRARPGHFTSRVNPFIDARAGFMHAFDQFASPFDDPLIAGGARFYGTRYSQGFGGVAGGGAEFQLTRRLDLTTGASVMRNELSAYRIYGAPTTASNGSFWMTSYRYTVGLRYNPIRIINQGSR
jgi:hypothetical protein